MAELCEMEARVQALHNDADHLFRLVAAQRVLPR
jgi:hypothetical protein